jgi:hypothetical protein
VTVYPQCPLCDEDLEPRETFAFAYRDLEAHIKSKHGRDLVSLRPRPKRHALVPQ